MPDPFPVGEDLGGNAYLIQERIRGTPFRGMYRAIDRRGSSPGTLLVTVGSVQQRLFRDLERELALPVEGVTRLRHVGPLGGHEEEYHALVEDEPAGLPSSDLPLPLEPGAAVRLGLDLARVLARAHRAGLHLPHVRPELVYAEESAGGPRLTAVAPRAEPFLAGAVSPSPGVPPLFDSIYAAPEVLALAPPAPAADVFALCASLNTWVTGEPPFPGDGVAAQLTSLHAGTRRAWTGPARLGDVLASGLDPDPARRPDLDLLVTELSALEEGS